MIIVIQYNGEGLAFDNVLLFKERHKKFIRFVEFTKVIIASQ